MCLIFLPWTGIMYALLWSPVGGVEGAEWILVSLAVAVDIMSASARAAKEPLRVVLLTWCARLGMTDAPRPRSGRLQGFSRDRNPC